MNLQELANHVAESGDPASEIAHYINELAEENPDTEFTDPNDTVMQYDYIPEPF